MLVVRVGVRVHGRVLLLRVLLSVEEVRGGRGRVAAAARVGVRVRGGREDVRRGDRARAAGVVACVRQRRGLGVVVRAVLALALALGVLWALAVRVAAVVLAVVLREAGVPVLVLVLLRGEVRVARRRVRVRRHLVREGGQDRRRGRGHGRAVGREGGGGGERRDGRGRGMHAVVGVRVDVVERPIKDSNNNAGTPMAVVMGEGEGEVSVK